jgi:two-component system, LuxR family, sensor kinase FixL
MPPNIPPMSWIPAQRTWAIAVGYLAIYVVLDWASFVQPFGPFGITPWNPHTGLTFALILLCGRRYVPLLFAAPFLADLIVRRLPAPMVVEVLLCAVIGVGYAAATLILLHPQSRFHIALSRLRDIWVLVAVTVSSAAVVTCAYVAILTLAGLIAWSEFGTAAARYWVGDVIGIATVTPFILVVMARRQWPSITWETLGQLAVTFSALWLLFGRTGAQQLHLFYMLFLPIIWISLRSGLSGACAGLVVIQLALILSLEFLVRSDVDVTTYQEMMLVLTLTGLAAGGVVMERERAEYQLRLQQDAQARLARLGSVNELSAAVAHEINQPLSAAATYTRLLVEALESDDFSTEQARESATKANSQVQRAAAVVRQLRDVIQTGKSRRQATAVEQIIGGALELLRPELHRAGASISCEIARGLPSVAVDALQIQQVLINLIRNAWEAMEEAGTKGAIVLRARSSVLESVELTVRDEGPGFDAEQLANPFSPFRTTKRTGLGVGLNLCRSIVEAHGGRIWIANGTRGAEVHFTLRAVSTQL